MDDQRSADALVDGALDRQIEAALAVDPSPEFLARVRTRIASEPDPSARRLPWTFAVCGAAVAAVVLAVVLVQSSRTSGAVPVDSPVLSARGIDWPPAAVPAIDPRRLLNAPSTVGIRANTSGGERPTAGSSGVAPDLGAAGTVVSGPKVLIDVAEARALRRLLAGARAGRIDLTPLPEAVPASAALQSPMEIVIAPIGVEPLVPINVEGARQ